MIYGKTYSVTSSRVNLYTILTLDQHLQLSFLSIKNANDSGNLVYIALAGSDVIAELDAGESFTIPQANLTPSMLEVYGTSGSSIFIAVAN